MKPRSMTHRSLLARTALASGLIVILQMPAAHAQNLPTNGSVVSGPATIDTSVANKVTVDLNGANAIVNWNRFDVGSGRSVIFQSTLAGPPATTDTAARAILNRVVGNAGTFYTSNITGTIDASNGGNNNIAVWLVNPAGITFNSGASYSGGSLILSTLDVPDADFPGGGATHFSASTGLTYDGSATQAIAIKGNLSVGGDLIVIGQNVALGNGSTRTIGADGRIAVIAADAVTFDSGIGSPLTFTIGTGSSLLAGDGTGVRILGQTSISGQSVTVAAVSQAAAITNVLQADSGAGLTATAAGGVVTLATKSVGTVSVTSANANDALDFATGGTGGLAVTGAGGGPISLAGAGAITFDGTVSGVTDLAVDGATIAFNRPTVMTAGTQSYTGAVTLGADAALTGSTVSFAGTVDGGATPFGLSIIGNGSFGGAVTTASVSVSGAAALNGGTVTTTGTQSYGTVTLGADATLTGTSVAFNSTVDGGHALTVDADAAFNGAVGMSSQLVSLDAKKTATIAAGAVSTSGTQTYRGAVTVAADTTLTASSLGFLSTVDSDSTARVLGIQGNVSFGGAVGGGNPLASLLVSGASAIGGGGVTTTGTQTYGGLVTIDTALTTLKGSGVAFQFSLDGTTADANGLKVDGNASFTGAVGATTRLDTLEVTGTSAINGGTVSTAGGQTYTGAATLGANTTLSSATGTIAFSSTLDSDATARTLAVNGDASFGGAVGSLSPLAGLTVNAPTSITATGNIAASGTIALNSVGTISVAGLSTTGSASDILINQTGTPGAVTVDGTVSAGRDYKLKATTVNLGGTQSAVRTIDITTTTGDITGSPGLSLNANTGIGGYWLVLDTARNINLPGSTLGAGNWGVGLRYLSGADVTLGNVTAAGLVEVDSTHNSIANYGLGTTPLHDVTLGTVSTPSFPLSFPITATGAVQVDAIVSGGPVSLQGNSVRFGTASSTSSATSLSVTSTGGGTVLAGTINTGGGTQTYNGASTLSATTSLTASNVSFTNTLDGPGGLSITGPASFGGAIGGVTPLASLSVTGTATLGVPSIHTVNDQTFGSAVTLTADTDLTSDAGTVYFQSTVNSDATARGLTIHGGARFDGAVGNGAALASLTVTGASALNGGYISTVGNQAFGGAAVLGAGTTLLTSGASQVSFGSTLDGNGTAWALGITGNAAFTGAVGGTSPLRALTVNAPTTITATGNITTAGTITLNAPGSINVMGLAASGATSDILINQSGTAGSVAINGAVSTGRDYKLKATTVALSGAQSAPGMIDITATTGSITGAPGVSLTANAGNPGGTNWLVLDAAGGIDLPGSTLDAGNWGVGLRYASGADVTIGDVVGVGVGVIDVSHTNGSLGFTAIPVHNLTIGTVTTSLGLPVTASGAVRIDAVVSSGAVSLQGSSVQFGTATSTTTADSIAITSTGGGTVLAGTINTNGTQTYTGAVTLSDTTSLTASNVSFVNTLDGPGGLTVTGPASFGGAVGGLSPLAALSVSGTSAIRGGSVATTSAQTYTGAVTIDTALTTLTGSAIAFGSTLDGTTADTNALAIVGDASFGGVVGGTIRLKALSVGGASAIDGGAIATAGTQTYTGAVTLGANTALAASNAAFGSTLDSAGGIRNLAITGGATFNDTVGGNSPLGVLSVSGAAMLGGDRIVTTVSESFGSATLLRDVILDTPVASFPGTVNGAHRLETLHDASFAGAVGGTTALASLAIDGASTIGGSVTTTGAQDYTGAVMLTGGGAKTLTGSSIAFAATLDGASPLTIAGNTSFGGAVGGATALTSLAVTGTSALDGGAITTGGDQLYGGPVTLGADNVLTGGNVRFASTLDSDGTPRSLNVTGNGRFDGVVGGAQALSALSVSGTSAINTTAITTTGAQNYVGAATLGTDAVLTGSAIGFGGGLTGAHTLGIAGDARFGGAVSLTALSVSGASAIDGGTVTTTATQSYAAPVTLGADAVLTASSVDFASTLDSAGAARSLAINGAAWFGGAVGNMLALSSLSVSGATAIDTGAIVTNAAQAYAGPVTLNTDATLTGSTIGFGGTVDGAHRLDIVGGASFRGVVGGGTALSALTVSGASVLGGGAITTSGSQAYAGPVTLGADTTLTGATIGFGGTVDGAKALTIAGNAAFGGAVGGTTALTSLAVSGTTGLGGPITTSGAQSYGGAVTLDADSNLAGATIGFGGTVDGAHLLAVTGNATFAGAVGGGTALAGLSVSGASAINGGSVKTSGAQTYAGATRLGADTTLAASLATFGSTLDSSGAARDLNVIGNAAFGGAVGSSLALDTLTVSGQTAISAGSIRTSGAQNYQGAATLGADSTLTASSIAFGATLDGAHALTIAGDTSFAGNVGGTTRLAALSVTAPNTISAGGSIAASGPIALAAPGVNVAGDVAAGGALTINAASLSVGGTAASGGALTIDLGSGAVQLGSLNSGSSATVTGGTITITNAATTAGALTLTAGSGALQLGSATSGGDVALTAKTKATLGAVSASGHAVTLSAADADLNGAITANAVTIVDNGASGNTLRLGDNAPGSGGFQLGAAEINRIAAATVVLDAGTGAGLTRQDVAIGNLALTNAALRALTVATLQRLDLTGGLVGSGLQSLRLGGSAASATDMATALRVAAQPDGSGGRIDAGGAALDLRAVNIGVGLDNGFLAVLGLTPGSTATQTADALVGNAASALYNSLIGGGAMYSATAGPLIVAGKMTVRYSGYALFQNTALSGGNEGAMLGTASAPGTPALSLVGPNPPDAGPFAIFGQINGIGGIQASILGPAAISLTAVDRTTARVNGCLVGSAAGCLTSTALTAGLTSLTPTRPLLIIANTDFVLPFDPLVATNNDALFGDVGTFGLADITEPPVECAPDGKNCDSQKGKPKQ